MIGTGSSMSTIFRRLGLGLILAACVATTYAASGQIAIGGSWGTGYVGLLAHHGMPRERLLDPQLADPEVLKRYNVVIVSGAVRGWEKAQAVIERYVQEGGCAWLECSAPPSLAAFPGARVEAQAGPNFVIEAANHPTLAALSPGRMFVHAGQLAAAIIPEPAANALVLARYTEEGVPDKIKGKFVLNGQSLPAILYRQYGKGHYIFSGPWLGYGMAFGRDYSDLILALLRFLTNGNVVPRLSLAGTENVLAGRTWETEGGETTDDSAPTAQLPEGYTLVEDLSGRFRPYNLTGTIMGPVQLLLDGNSARGQYTLELTDGQPVKVVLEGPTTEQIGFSGERIRVSPGARVTVARRKGSIRVFCEDNLLVEVADRGAWGGVIACRGLADPNVQPVETVEFADEFMQEAGQATSWKTVSGKWAVISTEGEVAQGPNPFAYGVETEDSAISIGGEWFWEDYLVEVSVRWMQNVAGLIVNYRNDTRYDLFEADLANQAVRFVQVREGERKLVREAPVELRPWQWYRLAVKTSRGALIGLVDNRPLIEAESDLWNGSLGLYARATKAAFDDVRATLWRVGGALTPITRWRPVSEGLVKVEGGKMTVRGVIQAAEPWGDLESTCVLRLGKANEVGVRLRDTGSEAGVVSLKRDKSGLILRLLYVRAGAPPIVLGSAVVRQQPDDWLELSVKAVSERVYCAVQGGPALLRAAPLPRAGQFALFAEGGLGAECRALSLRTTSSNLYLADPPTPAYAGAVDVMTWAGVAFSWLPDPQDLDLFWHEGETPGPVRLRVGIHKGDDPQALADLFLAEHGGAPESGYHARFSHTWGTPQVAISLSRAGRQVAQTTHVTQELENGYLVDMERYGPTVILRVNGQTALTYNDEDPPLECPRVGVRLRGTRLCYDDLVLERAGVRTYTFAHAPADWLVQRGTWEVTSRWTCSPGWTWMSGLDTRHALVQSKWNVQGDVMLDTYVGAKMMQTPAGRKEVLQDIRLGICGQPGYLNAGYFFIVGAKGGSWTALQRNGLVVAEASDFVLPQGSVHNDWTRLTVRKVGPEVSLLCQGQPVLTYTDPDPLPGGRVAIGTWDNGVMIPRITVYGQIN
ncbi:MAG: hypothetical protein ACUVX8_10460 [Candidatus Zipacnadales bacterium]